MAWGDRPLAGLLRLSMPDRLGFVKHLLTQASGPLALLPHAIALGPVEPRKPSKPPQFGVTKAMLPRFGEAPWGSAAEAKRGVSSTVLLSSIADQVPDAPCPFPFAPTMPTAAVDSHWKAAFDTLTLCSWPRAARRIPRSTAPPRIKASRSSRRPRRRRRAARSRSARPPPARPCRCCKSTGPTPCSAFLPVARRPCPPPSPAGSSRSSLISATPTPSRTPRWPPPTCQAATGSPTTSRRRATAAAARCGRRQWPGTRRCVRSTACRATCPRTATSCTSGDAPTRQRRHCAEANWPGEHHNTQDPSK
jgi:hypothetical protein